MCGIAGILGYEGAGLESKVRAMEEVIPYRGPDDHGTFVSREQGLGFAHRRLSILDTSTAGAQPMVSEDGTVVITYNGEVYNFLEIRQILEAKGYTFRTGTDTEVILAAYDHWGRDCLEHFNGMWAFALFDRKKQEVFLARDRMGIKPLYYHWSGDGTLYFASEVKSILAALDTSPTLEPGLLNAYMDFGYVPGGSTLFSDIHRLLPGHSMVVDLKQMRFKIHAYWDLEFDSREDLGLDHYVEEGRELLNSAIDLRLRSDVPLGIFLSGGLDSSTVVGLLAPRVDRPLKTFSVAYDFGKDFNETPYARQVARQFRTDHHEFFVTQKAFMDFIPDFIRYMDEPVTEAAAISLYFISKQARDHVTVILSGEGSDEIFAGYDFYRYMTVVDQYHRLAGKGLSRGMARAAALLPAGNKFRKYLALGAMGLADRYKGISTYDSEMKHRLFRRGVLQEIMGDGTSGPEAFVRDLFSRTQGWDSLNRMLYFDTKTWLVDDLLIKADRMSMAASLELRVPFLDYRMVEFAARIPTRYKINKGCNKYLLKEIMAPVLPRKIVHRKKMGFPTPLKMMFQDELSGYAREVLTQDRAWIKTYFNGNVIEKLLGEHMAGTQDHHRVIWQLLVLETWAQTWLKK